MWAGRVHRVLRILLEPPGDTRAQVCISPGVLHFTRTARPLVDTTQSICNPHFKAKAIEAWSASETVSKAYMQPVERAWTPRPRPWMPQAEAGPTAPPLS